MPIRLHGLWVTSVGWFFLSVIFPLVLWVCAGRCWGPHNCPCLATADKIFARRLLLMASLHEFKGTTLGGGTRAAPTDGAEYDFAQLKGKVVLINNVATM